MVRGGGAKSGSTTITETASNRPQAIGLFCTGEYAVCALHDQAQQVKGGASISIKMTLCLGNGAIRCNTRRTSESSKVKERPSIWSRQLASRPAGAGKLRIDVCKHSRKCEELTATTRTSYCSGTQGGKGNAERRGII